MYLNIYFIFLLFCWVNNKNVLIILCFLIYFCLYVIIDLLYPTISKIKISKMSTMSVLRSVLNTHVVVRLENSVIWLSVAARTYVCATVRPHPLQRKKNNIQLIYYLYKIILILKKTIDISRLKFFVAHLC